jgi:hypothetical protein
MRRSNFTLRLQSSLLEEARKVAELEGVAHTSLRKSGKCFGVTTAHTASRRNRRAQQGAAVNERRSVRHHVSHFA